MFSSGSSGNSLSIQTATGSNGGEDEPESLFHPMPPTTNTGRSFRPAQSSSSGRSRWPSSLPPLEAVLQPAPSSAGSGSGSGCGSPPWSMPPSPLPSLPSLPSLPPLAGLSASGSSTCSLWASQDPLLSAPPLSASSTGSSLWSSQDSPPPYSAAPPMSPFGAGRMTNAGFGGGGPVGPTVSMSMQSGIGGGGNTPNYMMNAPPPYLPVRRPRQKIQFTHCVFCQNNGEDESYYMSHTCKDAFGHVVCPVLRAYVCPICQATGPVAHTIKYCPQNKGDKYHENFASITVLKKMNSSIGRPKNPFY